MGKKSKGSRKEKRPLLVSGRPTGPPSRQNNLSNPSLHNSASSASLGPAARGDSTQDITGMSSPIERDNTDDIFEAALHAPHDTTVLTTHQGISSGKDGDDNRMTSLGPPDDDGIYEWSDVSSEDDLLMGIVRGSDGEYGVSTMLNSIAAVLFWLIFNILLNLYNKILFEFEHFRFPVFIIMSNMMASTFIYLLFITVTGKWSKLIREVQEHWRLALSLSFFGSYTVAMENISLSIIKISTNQVIKSSVPLLLLVLSVYFEGKRYSKKVFVSTGFIVLGTFLSLWHNPDFQIAGVILAFCSMLFGAVQTLQTAILLHKRGISTLTLTVFATCTGAIMLFPVFMFLEWGKLREFNSKRGTDTQKYILISTVLSVAYNLAHFVLIRYTSSAYSVIVGNFKTVLLIILSVNIFHTHLTTLNLWGMVLTLAAFLVYNLIRLHERKYEEEHQPVRLQALPDDDDDFHSDA